MTRLDEIEPQGTRLLSNVSPRNIMWTEILKFVGGSTILLTAVVWVIKALAKQLLSKDIERYRSELKLESITHQVRFTKLHEQRAEIIKNLYSKIVELDHAATGLNIMVERGSAWDALKKQADDFFDKICDLRRFISFNGIYFSDELVKNICELNFNLCPEVLGIYRDYTENDKGCFLAKLKEKLPGMKEYNSEIKCFHCLHQPFWQQSSCQALQPYPHSV